MKKRTRKDRFIAYYRDKLDEPKCGSCEFFYRHYTKEGFPINGGHCVYPGMKYKDFFDLCDNFAKRTEK